VQLVPHQPASRPAEYVLADWSYRSAPERMAFLRSVVEDAAQDTRIRAFAVAIVSAHGFVARDYENHARLLLEWVQGNIKYVPEEGEILQDPRKTLELGFGDCDDQVLLLATLFASVGLPYRFVLAGHAPVRSPWRAAKTAQPVRWVEGTRCPVADWKHIYLAVGWPVHDPRHWAWADPSEKDAPLGWDVFTGPLRQRNFALAGTEDGAAAPATPGIPEWTSIARDIFLYASAGVISAVVSTLILDALKHRR
jgi:hypothetical protein